MCGITGWIDWERDLTQHSWLVEQMARRWVIVGPMNMDAGCLPKLCLGIAA